MTISAFFARHLEVRIMLICLVFHHNGIDLFRRLHANMIDGNVPNTFRKALVAFDELMRGANQNGWEPNHLFDGFVASEPNTFIEAVVKVGSRRVGHDRLVIEINPELYGRLDAYARNRQTTLARIVEIAITYAAAAHNIVR